MSPHQLKVCSGAIKLGKQDQIGLGRIIRQRMSAESIDVRTFAQLTERTEIVIVSSLDRSRGKQQNLRHARSPRTGLEVVVPDRSQHLFAFRELFFRHWIRGRPPCENQRFQPMPDKKKGLEQSNTFTAVTF